MKILYVKMLLLYVKMLLLDMVGLPVVLSSPPRLRFFILFYPPPNAESHGIRGLQGFTVYANNTMIKAKSLIYKACKV